MLAIKIVTWTICFLQVQEVVGEAGILGFWKGFFPDIGYGTCYLALAHAVSISLLDFLSTLFLPGQQSFNTVYVVWDPTKEVEAALCLKQQ